MSVVVYKPLCLYVFIQRFSTHTYIPDKKIEKICPSFEFLKNVHVCCKKSIVFIF